MLGEVTAVELDAGRARQLQKIVRSQGADNVRVVNADARTSIEGTPDAVYIDPMFPPKRKRGALAHKGVRLLRTLVGVDDDAAELLEAARERAHRVVVKRPTWAEPIAVAPSLAITAKLVRYDVYLA